MGDAARQQRPRLEGELRERVHVSQPVARGPVWLTAEAQPGALLRQSDAGYGRSPFVSSTYPATATVRLHRQVA